MSEPKDKAAPGSPRSPSISSEAKFLSAERKEFSPPPESGWAERSRLDLPAGWIRLAFSPLQSSASTSSDFRVVWFVGDTESPLGVAGTAHLAAPGCSWPSCRTMLQQSTGDTLLSRPEFLLLLPGAGESGRAGTACPAGAASSPGSLARSSQHREPLGPCSPLCAPVRSPALLFSATLKSKVPSIPKSAPSSQGQARGILFKAGKTEVGREETRRLDLMGRACSSDQIIINNWVWGALPPPSTAPAPSVFLWEEFQRRKTSEWKLNSSLFLLD